MYDEEVNATKESMEDKSFSMKDNTVEHDGKKQLSFAKLHMSANVVDFLMEHYGFFDLVELNTITFYIMKTLGHMEKDGCKFAVYKTEDGATKSYQLDFHDLIAKIRIQLAHSMSKEKNEKDSV